MTSENTAAASFKRFAESLFCANKGVRARVVTNKNFILHLSRRLNLMKNSADCSPQCTHDANPLLHVLLSSIKCAVDLAKGSGRVGHRRATISHVSSVPSSNRTCGFPRIRLSDHLRPVPQAHLDLWLGHRYSVRCRLRALSGLA